MNRFFLSSDSFQNSKVIFPTDRSHQISRVLRLKVGDQVIVLDNHGYEYFTELTKLDARGCEGETQKKQKCPNEPAAHLHLLLALTQREKFEWILQKCTEIGVGSFTPLICERSLSQDVDLNPKKLERWSRIVMEAAEQSQRAIIPEIHRPVLLRNCLDLKYPQKLVAFEDEHTTSIHNCLSSINCADIALMIGPEGGFSENEINLAVENDWKLVTLGKRILRMETAAIVASTLVLNVCGDLG